MKQRDPKLKEQILRTAAAMLYQAPPEGLRMRELAKACNIATGTLYNYFPNKTEIMLALAEDFWSNSLAQMAGKVSADSFVGYVQACYELLCIQTRYFCAHILPGLNARLEEGRQLMQSMQEELERVLLKRLIEEPGVCAWQDGLSPESFARMVTELLMLALRERHDREGAEALLTLIRRVMQAGQHEPKNQKT